MEMNTSISSPTAPEATGYWSGLPGWFHAASGLTLITGMVLHGTRLFVGPEYFQQHIFTPLVDSIFAIPMTIAGVLMLILVRRAILPRLWERIAYWFVTLFFLGSIVLHTKTIYTWDTSYVNAFPAWYPVLAVVYLGLMLVFCATRRFGAARAA
jgi:hypothetical protein